MKKILHELNIMDILLCLFVIFIHASSEAVGLYNKNSLQFAVVFFLWKFCSLAVPCFIFLAGFRFFYSSAQKSSAQKSRQSFNYSSYIKSRFLRVYIPYVIWVVVYYVYFVFNNYFPFNAGELALYIVRGDLVAHFYFIIVIFQFYLLAPVWLKIFSKAINPYFAIAASFIIMALLKSIGIRFGFKYNDYLFTTYIAYWTAGCFFGMHYERFSKKYPVKAITVFAVIGLIHLILSYLSAKGVFLYTFAEQAHVVYCLAGCYLMYYGCLFLYKHMLCNYGTNIKGKANEEPSLIKNPVPMINLKRHKTSQGTSIEPNLNAVDLSSLITISKLSGASFYVYLSHIMLIIYMSDRLTQLGINSVTLRLIIRGATGLIIPFVLSMLYLMVKSSLKTSSANRQRL